MATFGELQTEIAQKLDQSYLTSQIATAINRTITYLQPYHFWFNTDTATITLTVNDPLVPDLPTDFQYEITDGGLVVLNGQVRYILKKVHNPQYDVANVQGQGLPYIYANKNGNLYVYFYPDQAYTLYLNYVKKYVDLSGDNDTNNWTDNATRLIVAQCLADLYLDQRKSKEYYDFYQARANNEMKELQRRNKRRIGTGELVIDSALYHPVARDYPYFRF